MWSDGYGQDGVVGVSEGSTVGVAIGEFDDDGRGGVFRIVGGGAVDSWTIVVFGILVGDVLGCTVVETPGVGTVADALVLVDDFAGSLGSVPLPGLVRFGWPPVPPPVVAGFGAAHFGHAAEVC